MTHSILPFSALAAMLSIVGCHPGSEEKPPPAPETPPAARQPLAQDQADYPARAVRYRRPSETAQPRLQLELFDRMRAADRTSLLVVHVKVLGSKVSERSVPRRAGGARLDRLPTTAVRLQIERTLCGAAGDDTLVASYVGGKVPGGRSLAWSDMPKLSPGREYVLILEQVEGEWFLANGDRDVLDAVSDASYRHQRGDLITQSEIGDNCP